MDSKIMNKVNLTAIVLVQAGIAVLCWGGFGVAKTEFFRALAKGLGLEYLAVIPSQMNEDDIAGIPHAVIDKTNLSNSEVRMVPLAMWKAMMKGNCLLCVDEFTTADERKQAPLMRLLQERKIGDLQFPDSVLIVALTNPVEITAGGTELAPPVKNRMYHHQWKLPFDDWCKGMMAGGDWSNANTDYPVLPENWKDYIPQWCATICRLCMKHPEIRETVEVTGDEYGMPTLRTWHKTAVALAACDSLGLVDTLQHEVATGLVGDNAAGILTKYLAGRKLYDPADVLDGKINVEISDDHIDQLIYLPMALLEELDRKASNDRLTVATEILIDMAENNLLDCAAPALREIKNKHPKFKMPAKAVSRYREIAKMIGGVK